MFTFFKRSRGFGSFQDQGEHEYYQALEGFNMLQRSAEEEQRESRANAIANYLGKDVHPVLGRLHPSIVGCVDWKGEAFKVHQLRKCEDPEYRKEIPVFVNFTEQQVTVEIDSWESEHGLMLNSYGIGQTIELMGLEPLRTYWGHPCYFFGDHFFDIRYVDNAIQLANFAATRRNNPDFKYWFD